MALEHGRGRNKMFVAAIYVAIVSENVIGNYYLFISWLSTAVWPF